MNLRRNQLIFALLFAAVFTFFLYFSLNHHEQKKAKNKIEQKEMGVSLVINKNIKLPTKTPKVAVLDFRVTVGWGDKEDATDIQLKKNIARKNREKMELALLQAGFNLVERSTINKVIEEQETLKDSLSENNLIKIGKLLNSDIVVFGSIPQWTFYNCTDEGYLEIITKGIYVNSGVVLFKGTISHHFISEEYSFRYDIAVFETRGFKMLGEQLGEWLNQDT